MPPESPTGNSQWVDPLIGCDPADLPDPSGIAATWWCAKPPIGNTHPGATLPFGMVSACAYSGAYVTGYGKYAVSLSGDTPETLFDEHAALGIAHFQQSGTGRIRMYYNYFLTTPLVGDGLTGIGNSQLIVDEFAKPGFYSGRFAESAVSFEVTCTKRTVLHRYSFPDNCRGKIAIDFTSGGLLIEGMESYPEKAKARPIDLQTYGGRVFLEGIPFYFTVKCLTEVRDSGFWEDGKIITEEGGKFKASKASRKQKLPFGIWFEALNKGDPIEVRISFSLHDKHRPNEALKLGYAQTFEQTTVSAADRWDSILGKIDVKGGTDEMRTVFYTALYHATIKPADFMDENPFAPGDGPFFFDLSTLWDLYKTQLPLVMTLWPELGRDFVTFLIEVARREGAFPISYLMDNAPERFAKQATGLCHMILTDANMRGIDGEWNTVLELLWKTSLSGTGRGGKFSEFAKHHVVQPLSHTLDLAFANWCIAQLAKTLGDQVIYDRSIPLAYHWRNAFDETTGLLREDSDYYEGENWNYSFRFIHDMVGRINLAGGETRFVELLDLFFGFAEPNPGQTVHRFEGLNNEPDMEAPYAYLFAGRHDRTAEIVRNVMKYQFTTGRGGLPGNDDSGGLSSWYVWSAVGLFPVTGLPIMLIGSPIFDKATLHLLGGDFTVIAENQGPDNFYVQSAELNGQQLDRCYLKISEFAAEATLKLTMGPQPSEWATATRPPSFLT
ncbi:glycoside hydrolase family 92 protein [Verrucomicrobiales bacterium]|nr:glycoside hydrolase family 92 protein [Verrucomicrobiales bacterium]